MPYICIPLDTHPISSDITRRVDSIVGKEAKPYRNYHLTLMHFSKLSAEEEIIIAQRILPRIMKECAPFLLELQRATAGFGQKKTKRENCFGTLQIDLNSKTAGNFKEIQKKLVDYLIEAGLPHLVPRNKIHPTAHGVLLNTVQYLFPHITFIKQPNKKESKEQTPYPVSVRKQIGQVVDELSQLKFDDPLTTVLFVRAEEAKEKTDKPDLFYFFPVTVVDVKRTLVRIEENLSIANKTFQELEETIEEALDFKEVLETENVQQLRASLKVMRTKLSRASGYHKELVAGLSGLTGEALQTTYVNIAELLRYVVGYLREIKDLSLSVQKIAPQTGPRRLMTSKVLQRRQDILDQISPISKESAQIIGNIEKALLETEQYIQSIKPEEGKAAVEISENLKNCQMDLKSIQEKLSRGKGYHTHLTEDLLGEGENSTAKKTKNNLQQVLKNTGGDLVKAQQLAEDTLRPLVQEQSNYQELLTYLKQYLTEIDALRSQVLLLKMKNLQGILDPAGGPVQGGGRSQVVLNLMEAGKAPTNVGAPIVNVVNNTVLKNV